MGWSLQINTAADLEAIKARRAAAPRRRATRHLACRVASAPPRGQHCYPTPLPAGARERGQGLAPR
eukprot:scaffold4858_cov60-Phaeocystis_antarctica.AAC.2